MASKAKIIGGGLAGCEAAWQVLSSGHEVTLYEMRPAKQSGAHQTGNLAELVCSNSLKSMDPDSATGQLKFELGHLNSLTMKAALAAKIPAGRALAVDREMFSSFVEEELNKHPAFYRKTEEITTLPTLSSDDLWIVATGPLTSDSLTKELLKLSMLSDGQGLYFYDAIAPIVAAETINYDFCFKADRYDKNSDGSSGDYLNIPLDERQYSRFIDAVASAPKVKLHDFEKERFFEACLPIEVMVARGRDTLRFGPMKPVGLIDPKTNKRPYANLQLRQETKSGSMYNLVGFQTKMTWTSQKEVFSLLPGLEKAEFLRYGSIHRNTYLESPKVLNEDLSFKKAPHIFLSGQITGVEGYLESAAIGLLVGKKVSSLLSEKDFTFPPPETMIGALYSHVIQGTLSSFQPMNANAGILPEVASLKTGKKSVRKTERKALVFQRAREKFGEWRDSSVALLPQNDDRTSSRR